MSAVTVPAETGITEEIVTEVTPVDEAAVVGNVERFFAEGNVSMMGGWTD